MYTGIFSTTMNTQSLFVDMDFLLSPSCLPEYGVAIPVTFRLYERNAGYIDG